MSEWEKMGEIDIVKGIYELNPKIIVSCLLGREALNYQV